MYLFGISDDGLTVLHDELVMFVLLGENETVRSDATADVDDDGVLRKVLPAETCKTRR